MQVLCTESLASSKMLEFVQVWLSYEHCLEAKGHPLFLETQGPGESATVVDERICTIMWYNFLENL